MIRLYLSLSYSTYVELKEHLYYNGYHVSWESQEIIDVDEDEIEEVKTILRDRGIYYTE